ncbi:LAT2 domain-containing protein isoform X4 [Synchiropus splendidus]|uniref:LAT2 domain-containing protein isoform X4 n=1 Tax=Synchiropus splendidus TaxID=270530 RepID=UPI00237D9542|nr:LAT2 domain-containing protein isoform X4 [Synchiropus splendidus]
MSPSLQAAVLALASLASLSLCALLCLRCRRRGKPKIIHEETQIYNPQVFSRGGSRFAVVRSKTVTRANQMSPAAPGEPAGDPAPRRPGESEKDDTYIVPFRDSVSNEYENKETIRRHVRSQDAVYQNEVKSDGELACVWFQGFASTHSALFADSDYENSEFLATQEEENDYVNLHD